MKQSPPLPYVLFVACPLFTALAGTAGYVFYHVPLFPVLVFVLASVSFNVLIFLKISAERKKADETLCHQRAYYNKILESSHESLLIIDRQFKIVEMNNNLLKVAGRRREDVIGRPCYSITHARTSPCFEDEEHRCPVAFVFKTGLRRSCVHRHYRVDGRPYEVEVTASPLEKENGNVTVVVETMRDVTQLKHLKSLFLEAQKTEAVARLAGGIAHDFNNLMNIVIGYSEMILQKISGDDPMRPGLENILEAGERSASLTKQLLAFSRRQIMELKVLDLNTVLSNLDNILRRVLGEGLELEFALGSNLGCVRADRGLIEQVLMNLAVNARDAMPNGGRLLMETANAELDEFYVRTHQGAKAGPYVLLAVSDTGTGISDEVKAHIYEPFFTTKEHGKGAGLGLSTVYGIVKQHMGYIMVYSEPGKGTTFKIYLPRVEDAAEPASRKAAEKIPTGTETILLVEDHEGLRNMAIIMLEGLGYTVLPCSAGDEALERLALYPGKVDLLFTDVVMPGMNGRTLAERVLAARSEIKVLFTSGYTDRSIASGKMLEPDAVFIQKPFTLANLGHKVREVLDKNP